MKVNSTLLVSFIFTVALGDPLAAAEIALHRDADPCLRTLEARTLRTEARRLIDREATERQRLTRLEAERRDLLARVWVVEKPERERAHLHAIAQRVRRVEVISRHLDEGRGRLEDISQLLADLRDRARRASVPPGCVR